MLKLRVYKQWLVEANDMDNKIVWLTLEQWQEYFKEEFDKITVYNSAGYGISEGNYANYSKKFFRTGNADLGLPYLIEADSYELKRIEQQKEQREILGLCDCDKCQKNCIHKNALRRLPKTFGGLGLCKNL